jgi:hypothetical protein
VYFDNNMSSYPSSIFTVGDFSDIFVFSDLFGFSVSLSPASPLSIDQINQI